ncbi:MAG: lipid-A-disaccharide synthase [Spiribacter sp.]|nr:lipid-A-disaccharide synthase [Spiribacter sp.]MDR9480407.1 lipid-A-disaccharide synthase [Spiribacter sp.]
MVKKIALVAGEPSGDALGAGVVRALAKRYPQARFEGIGGEQMQAAGLQSLYPLEALSVMGLAEVIRHLPRLLGIRRALYRHWRANPPDLFVGIDAPDFNLRLATLLRRQGIASAQYVSPTVWAWRPGRIKSIRQAVDRVLCIYPFEPDFFAAHGIDARFVGHPLADAIALNVDQASARKDCGLDEASEWVGLLPGSRRSEINRLMPILLKVVEQVHAQRPDTRFVIPVATPALGEPIAAAVRDHALAPRIEVIQGKARSVLAAVDAAVLASGTATLEAMLLRCPSLMVYQVSALTAFIARRSIQIDAFAMPNLMAGKPLMPEFVQQRARADLIAPALLELLQKPARRAEVSAEFEALHSQLRCQADQSAAAALADLLDERALGSQQ